MDIFPNLFERASLSVSHGNKKSYEQENNTQEEETSSRVIDSFIRRAVDEGDLDPDDMDAKKKMSFGIKRPLEPLWVGCLF